MHKVLHARHIIDNLYISRKEEGREVGSREDRVDTSIRRLEYFNKESKEKLITAIINNLLRRYHRFSSDHRS